MLPRFSRFPSPVIKMNQYAADPTLYAERCRVACIKLQADR
jgi:hypothetical protein